MSNAFTLGAVTRPVGGDQKTLEELPFDYPSTTFDYPWTSFDYPLSTLPKNLGLFWDVPGVTQNAFPWQDFH